MSLANLKRNNANIDACKFPREAFCVWFKKHSSEQFFTKEVFEPGEMNKARSILAEQTELEKQLRTVESLRSHARDTISSTEYRLMTEDELEPFTEQDSATQKCLKYSSRLRTRRKSSRSQYWKPSLTSPNERHHLRSTEKNSTKRYLMVRW